MRLSRLGSLRIQAMHGPSCNTRPRRLTCHASSSEDDIDALASFISREADAMRKRQPNERGLNQGYSERAKHHDRDEEMLVDTIGQPFDAADFELAQALGSMTMQTTTPDGRSTQRVALIAYAARYHPRLVNYSGVSQPAPVLLKEVLPNARPFALNELKVVNHICKIPQENKYQAAMERPSASTPPIVQILGYFLSAPSSEALNVAECDPDQDSLWIVYKWSGNRPLAMFSQTAPPLPVYSILRSREAAEEEAWRLREATLKATMRGVLQAIDYIHSADVVHGSLSSGTVLLGPWDGGSGGVSSALGVKLDGFGLGRYYEYGKEKEKSPDTAAEVGPQQLGPQQLGSQMDDSTLEAGKAEDLVAIALLLFEALVLGLRPGTPIPLIAPLERAAASALPSETLDSSAIRTLLIEVFPPSSAAGSLSGDFRSYCMESRDLDRLVSFLDLNEGAGWEMFTIMLQEQSSALELFNHPFFTSERERSQTQGPGKDQGGPQSPSTGFLGLKMPWSS